MRDRLLQFGLLIITFIIIFLGLRSHSLSWYFQDENDHVAVGWVLTQFEQKLYEDVVTNHQPIPVLVGGALANLIPYNSFFQLIDRLRIAMLSFYFVVGVYSVWRFRWTGLVATAILASFTYIYFGWHILAESLVAPGIVVLFLFMSLQARGERLSRFDASVLGGVLFWLFFNLIPLWPLVGLAGIWWLWQLDWPQRRWLLATGLIPTALLFLAISPLAWLEVSVLNNILYVIGDASPTDLLILTWYPMAHWLMPGSQLGRFYLLGSAFVISALLTKQRLRIQGLILLLWMLNTRTDHVNATFYEGFHLMPYLAGVAAVIAIAVDVVWQYSGQKWRWLIISCLLLLLANNAIWVLERKDRVTEFGIQYGPQQEIAEVINVIKMPGDTLTTGPDGSGYLNLLTTLPFGTKQNFHLDWSWRSPKLRQEFIDGIAQNPPVFYYFYTDVESEYYAYLYPVLSQDYHRFIRVNGSASDLYIRKTEIEKRSPQQWEELVKLDFNLPTSN